MIARAPAPPTRPSRSTRPLPLQAPTAFVRIRARGRRGCGESGTAAAWRCGARVHRALR